MSYRDPLATARAELATRQARVAELLPSIRPAHRAVVADEERDALERASIVLGAVPATVEDVARIHAQLDVLERAIEHADAALTVEVPESASPDPHERLDGLGAWMNHVVAPRAGFATQESGRWLAMARVHGVDVELEAIIDHPTEQAIHDLRFVLSSRVPTALAPISVRPQDLVNSIAKRIHLATEHEVGVRDVDDAYWIRGDDEAVRAILTPTVVRLLGRLSEHHPTLEISDGVARLTWATRPTDDINAALFEAMPPFDRRDATEKLVPPEAFELHHAIRGALEPSVVVSPSLMPEPVVTSPYRVVQVQAPAPIPEPDSPRAAELREAFREFGQATLAHQYGDYGIPCPSMETDPPFTSLGMEDLELIDQLAASSDWEVAEWAAACAAGIRRKHCKADVARSDAATPAAQLLATDTSEAVRVTIIERIRDDDDSAFVADLMARIVSDARFSRAIAGRVYNEYAIDHGVGALLQHSRSDVVEALLAMPPPVCIDAAVGVARRVEASSTAADLARRVHTMSVELRRTIVDRYVFKHVPTRVLRAFFRDEDGDVRTSVIGALLHRDGVEDFPEVARALRSDPEARVRRVAARSLARVGAPSAVREEAALRVCL